LFDKELRERNIELQLEANTNAEAVMDPDLFEQVIINLLRNAIDAVALKPAPVIHIRTTSAYGKIEIRMSDNGVGMGPELLDNIFIPFFTTKNNGSGIGLAVSKQILQLHSASIRVNSTVGEGSEFIVVI
jgi:signal transduction histidine kinase